MKKYTIAVVHTILLILIPLISMPLLQWYEETFLREGTEIIGIYLLLIIISFGMIILTGARWISAVTDTDFKDMFK